MAALQNIRNMGIIAHIDAGKTTLAERILFYTKEIYRMGEVDDGAATMDYMPEEQERGITIVASSSSCNWEGAVINIIDTPGHVDFTIEVERTLRVLDGAVCVLCATRGVEPQSETVWRQSEKFSIPKLVFVNKMDRVGADFEMAVESLRQRMGANPVPVQMPLFEDDKFMAIVDLITLEKLVFDPADQGSTICRSRLSGGLLEEAGALREKMLEAIADADEEFMELYLAASPVSAEAIEEAIRRATIELKIVPVFLGSALHNTGVQPLLSGVVKYLPDPGGAHLPKAWKQNKDGGPGERVELKSDPENHLACLVFKVVIDSGHPLAFTRVYSGKIKKGDSCYNASIGRIDKAAHIYKMHADEREAVESAQAGDVVALAGLHNIRTGHTLCDKDFPILLEDISAYSPVISRALEPANSEEAKKLDEALGQYLLEDPTLKLVLDEDTGQRVLSGMGELHLDIVLERLQREFQLAPRSGDPRVIFRETITQPAQGHAKVEKELGGLMHQGEVCLEVEPLGRSEANIIEFAEPPSGPEKISPAGQIVRQELALALESSFTSGPMSGNELAGIRVKVISYEKKSGAGLSMAASQALREALQKAGPVLLEPIMHLEIVAPTESMGDALNLLASCGGRVINVSPGEQVELIRAEAPMQNLFGFATSLRSVSKGRAGLTLTFDRFDVTP